MDHFEIYIWLLGIIICVGIIGRKIPVPTPLLLVIAGMLLSYVPRFPQVQLNENLVLNFILPLLVYESSTILTSWPDIKFNKRPIALLSIGHVIFITVIVAATAHAIIPQMNWPLAFVLGAVVSPPDDVAIFSIAERVPMPQRILTILMGEGLLNDASALILFRFSLAAVVTHEFYFTQALSEFLAIVIFETLYGFALGHIIGQIRLRLHDAMLQMLLSIMTPFIAYLPAVSLGGSGVLATVVTGLIIGHVYLERLDPSSRLLWQSVWLTIGFTLSSILFLLVGFHFRITLESIANIPPSLLFIYGTVITLVVIIGRFIWVYPAAYLPRILFKSIRKKDPYPPWQYPFVVSWAGMRGGVSLAAALAVPTLVTDSTDVRALLIFLVFCVITATLLIQGLSLPWLLKKLGVDHMGQHESGHERLKELSARVEMADAVLKWLHDYKLQIDDEDPNLKEAVKLQILEYQAFKKRLLEIIKNHDPHRPPSVKVSKRKSANYIFAQIVEIERTALYRLWHEGKISHRTRNKLSEQLDLRTKRYS